MYPANRDEILKGLESLTSTINQLLKSLKLEEMELTAQQSDKNSTSGRTAAELLFANPNDAENNSAKIKEQPLEPEPIEEEAESALEVEVMPATVVGEEQGSNEESVAKISPKDTKKVDKMLEVRMKLCQHVIMQVDSSLGDLHDMLDTMEYYQDEKFEQASRMVSELEDGTNALIAYLRAHNRY